MELQSADSDGDLFRRCQKSKSGFYWWNASGEMSYPWWSKPWASRMVIAASPSQRTTSTRWRWRHWRQPDDGVCHRKSPLLQMTCSTRKLNCQKGKAQMHFLEEMYVCRCFYNCQPFIYRNEQILLSSGLPSIHETGFYDLGPIFVVCGSGIAYWHFVKVSTSSPCLVVIDAPTSETEITCVIGNWKTGWTNEWRNDWTLAVSLCIVPTLMYADYWFQLKKTHHCCDSWKLIAPAVTKYIGIRLSVCMSICHTFGYLLNH